MRPPTRTRVRVCGKPGVVALTERRLQLRGEHVATEVVREGDARCTQLRELGAPLRDQLVLIAHVAPAFNDASRN